MLIKNENLYDIYLSKNLLELNSIMKGYVTTDDKSFIVTDDKVAFLYAPFISEFKEKYNSTVYTIKNGEDNKNYNTISEIYKFLIEGNADRNSIIIAFGGGVVGDLTGFVAATFMRGIRYINIPTTLISQVDSSVGGKVGYNYLNLKNSIGCFYSPILVYIASNFLSSLDKDQILNGMGEVIKYGLVKDKDLFEYIENNVENILTLEKEAMIHIIFTCLNIKNKVVSSDYGDKNIRNILNFGHTVGHGLETISNYELYHGSAVSLGMLTAIKLSEKKLGLSNTVYTRLENIYKKFGINYKYKVDNYNSFLYAIKHDKKNSDKLNFVLLKDIGQSEIKINVSKEELLWALENSICKES